MTFMPEGYEKPKTGGGYMKLQQGENRIRIFSRPIVGWIDRDNSGERPKPIRTKEKQSALGDNKPKHFRAMAVYDCKDEEVKILEITQSSIQNAIFALAEDEDRGNPKEYDIVVTRTGEKLETSYTVTPKPSKPLPQEAQELIEATKINLDALYDGEDPFEIDELDDDVPF